MRPMAIITPKRETPRKIVVPTVIVRDWNVLWEGVKGRRGEERKGGKERGGEGRRGEERRGEERGEEWRRGEGKEEKCSEEGKRES